MRCTYVVLVLYYTWIRYNCYGSMVSLDMSEVMVVTGMTQYSGKNGLTQVQAGSSDGELGSQAEKEDRWMLKDVDLEPKMMKLLQIAFSLEDRETDQVTELIELKMDTGVVTPRM